MSGRITSKSSNRLQIDTKHIWAQLIASKTKFPKSSASNRTTMPPRVECDQASPLSVRAVLSDRHSDFAAPRGSRGHALERNRRRLDALADTERPDEKRQAA